MKNLTDYIQFLELVKAGVPKESADYYYVKDCEHNPTEVRLHPPTFLASVPCWSIGALWDYLHETCVDVFDFDTRLSSDELMEALVKAAIMAREREDD